MSRRRTESWMLWLLPLFVLRLLLPTGVMPGQEPRGAALVLCSTRVLQPASSASTASERHSSRPGSTHAEALCPFAAAATLAAPSTWALQQPSPLLQDRVVQCPNAQCTAPSGPPRSQLSRAPPLLS